jgi:pimeloyl-ACP methyl ester carboxylesterase
MVNRNHPSVAGRLFVIVVVGAVVFLLLPLVIPVPDAEAVDPHALAGDASRFTTIDGLEVHYIQQGAGGRNVVLIHGDGGGTFSWSPSLDGLAALGTVTAYDRTGWGLSERPVVDSSTVENPYDASAHFRQFVSLMEELEITEMVIIGHGQGANLAVRLARALPDRVSAVVLESPVINAKDTSFLSTFQPLLRSPQVRHLAPFYVRRKVDTLQFDVAAAYFSPSKLTPELRAAYAVQTEATNWDRAMWENAVAPPLPDVAGELSLIEAPVLVVAGAGDPLVTLSRNEAIAEQLDAELITIGSCGHIVHEECADEFLAAVVPWLEANS